MKMAILVVAIALTILVSACTSQIGATDIVTKKDVMVEKPVNTMVKTDTEVKTPEGAVMEKKDEGAVMEKKVEGAMMTKYAGSILAGKTTQYIDFNQADYKQALADGKIIVLNFYASWCPSCKAEQPEAFAAFDALNDPKVVGFRVNYKDSDTDSDEQALAKEFGIAYQHTKVILKDGKLAIKNPEIWNKERYLAEIAKYN